jgi:5-hydroxyisourate hydrolase-like protein (transthyretin family)
MFTTKEGKKLRLMLLQLGKTNKAEGKFHFISAQYFHIHFLKALEAIIYFILLTFVFARAAFHSHVTLRN